MLVEVPLGQVVEDGLDGEPQRLDVALYLVPLPAGALDAKQVVVVPPPEVAQQQRGQPRCSGASSDKNQVQIESTVLLFTIKLFTMKT